MSGAHYPPTAELPPAPGIWGTMAAHREYFGEFALQTPNILHSAQEHSGCDGGDWNSRGP